MKYASERPHDCHDRRSPYGKRGLKSTGAGARRRSGVFLQVGIHSIGTIFQLHRRLVSNRNCSVGTRRPFSWLSGHEGVLAAVGASLESDEPAVAHGAVDQRGGHVLVAEHASPAGELDVRGVDHAPGLVGIRYDLEQEPGALLVDRHVAELVDDQEPRLGDLPELRVEPVLALRAAQPHEQPGRGEEPDRYRAHAREPAQRDREMGLAGADGPVEHEWIGNSVLDGFLEDESLFGEFLRTPVSKGGVEPLVVGPPHVVVEVMPQLLDRGVVVPVHELLLQRPVRRFDHGVVVGVALV